MCTCRRTKRYPVKIEKETIIKHAFLAIRKGDQDRFIELLEEHSFLVSLSGENRFFENTVLHTVAKKGLTHCVEALINARASLDERPAKCAYTPLHLALKAGQFKVAKILVEAKAGLNISSKNGGETPLMMAAYKGDISSLTMLLLAKADVGAKTDNGYTALHRALNAKATKPLELLIDAEADVDHLCNFGFSAYSLAISEVSRNCLLNYPSPQKLSRIRAANDVLQKKRKPKLPADIIRFIVELFEWKGADPNIGSTFGTDFCVEFVRKNITFSLTPSAL